MSSQPPEGPGSRSGTPAYLSPEQAVGAPADARSDLYSIGVLLYEMLTGTTPFHGATAADVAAKHVREAPRDPREHSRGVSPELARAVLKCLEKQAAGRFQSAVELRTELERLRSKPPPLVVLDWVLGHKAASLGIAAAALALAAWIVIPSSGPPSRTRTVAVLRASAAPGAGTGAGVAGRLQDLLSTGLAGIPELVVVPPITVNARDISGRDPKAIGRKLGADYLLEPGLHVEGERVGLTARLINARRNLVARTYELDRPAAGAAAAADEFAEGIATVIRFDIAEDRVQRSNKGLTSDLEARLLVHEGMTLVETVYPLRDHPDVFAAALAKYDQALAHDPGFALALWAKGNAYEARYNTSPQDLRDPRDVDRMCDYFSQAYARNPYSPETSIGLGWANFNRGDIAKSFEFFEKALALEPESAVVQLDAGAFLRSVGLYRQAIPHLAHAARLAPDDPEPVSQLANCLAALGRFEEAAARSVKAVALNPNDLRARLAHTLHLVLAGRPEDGAAEVEAMRRIRPDHRYLPFAEGLLAATRGDRERALALKGGTEFLTIPGTCFYLLLGMTGEALDNIEAGIAQGFAAGGDYLYSYPSLKANPAFAPLRGLARFRDIVARQKARYLKELKRLEDL
jgi:serine/threonine-protein kinase